MRDDVLRALDHRQLPAQRVHALDARFALHTRANGQHNAGRLSFQPHPSTNRSMFRTRHILPALLATVAALSVAGSAAAELLPVWSPQELSAFATLVVTGRVVDVSSQ